MGEGENQESPLDNTTLLSYTIQECICVFMAQTGSDVQMSYQEKKNCFDSWKKVTSRCLYLWNHFNEGSLVFVI